MTDRLPPGLGWIAFDLDDTLHYFKRASGQASEAVFGDIERQFGIGADDLRKSYGEILRTAQSTHFTQPKTSREYRAERFGALLSEFSLGAGPQLDRLLDIYDAALDITSAGEGASKGDGLFERALERAGCAPHEILYVGDSVDRDMVPTTALGIASVYVGDGELPVGSTAVRLDLTAVARLLSNEAPAYLTVSVPSMPASRCPGTVQ